MYKYFLKRFFDIILSGLALILLSPVFLILAILIRIKLGRKVIFTQYRLGKNKKVFKFFKFRSMADKRDENGELLPDKERMTKFGKLLRATSLDELPQLWNIFKGDMSIIGPRPRMVEECVFLNETQQDRFKMRPGITGWAQVNGRNSITFDKVVEFDKEYVNSKNTFGMDFKIFFKTIGKVFKKEGVTKEGTVSNEFYGDFLLRTGKISKEEYDKGIARAKQIIKNKKFE